MSSAASLNLGLSQNSLLGNGLICLVFIGSLLLDIESRLLVVLHISSPNAKILDWSKLKQFADDKINVTEKLKFVLGRVKNIVAKGENAGYQHFLLFP